MDGREIGPLPERSGTGRAGEGFLNYQNFEDNVLVHTTWSGRHNVGINRKAADVVTFLVRYESVLMTLP